MNLNAVYYPKQTLWKLLCGVLAEKIVRDLAGFLLSPWRARTTVGVHVRDRVAGFVMDPLPPADKLTPPAGGSKAVTPEPSRRGKTSALKLQVDKVSSSKSGASEASRSKVSSKTASTEKGPPGAASSRSNFCACGTSTAIPSNRKGKMVKPKGSGTGVGGSSSLHRSTGRALPQQSSIKPTSLLRKLDTSDNFASDASSDLTSLLSDRSRLATSTSDQLSDRSYAGRMASVIESQNEPSFDPDLVRHSSTAGLSEGTSGTSGAAMAIAMAVRPPEAVAESRNESDDGDSHAVGAVVDARAANTGSVSERMQELRQVLDAGFISHEEFDGKRKQILLQSTPLVTFGKDQNGRGVLTTGAEAAANKVSGAVASPPGSGASLHHQAQPEHTIKHTSTPEAAATLEDDAKAMIPAPPPRPPPPPPPGPKLEGVSLSGYRLVGSPPPGLKLEGGSLTGHAAPFYGTYRMVGTKLVNGRPVWQHSTNQTLCIAFDGSSWMGQPESSLGERNGHLQLSDAAASTPDVSSMMWKASTGSGIAWAAQPELRCTAWTPETALLDALEAAELLESFVDGPNLPPASFEVLFGKCQTEEGGCVLQTEIGNDAAAAGAGAACNISAAGGTVGWSFDITCTKRVGSAYSQSGLYSYVGVVSESFSTESGGDGYLLQFYDGTICSTKDAHGVSPQSHDEILLYTTDPLRDKTDGAVIDMRVREAGSMRYLAFRVNGGNWNEVKVHAMPAVIRPYAQCTNREDRIRLRVAKSAAWRQEARKQVLRDLQAAFDFGETHTVGAALLSSAKSAIAPLRKAAAEAELHLATHCVFLRRLGLESLPEKALLTLETLTRMCASENAMRRLPESIGRLAALTDLDVSKNQLENLPEIIGDLRALTKLNVSENALRSLPESIGRLAALTVLDASKNRIESLPASVGQLSSSLNILLLDNPLRSPPLSLVARGVPAIARYFTALKGEAAVVSRWGKLMLVGDGEVGKTSLLRALQRGVPAPTGRNERTIQLDLSELALGEGDNLTMLSCWDLGGQAPYAAAQQPFVVPDVLYLLVIRADRTNDAEYEAVLGRWLDVLQAGAPGAVVQPVLTRADSLHSAKHFTRCRTTSWLTFGASDAVVKGGKVRYEVTLNRAGSDPQIGWAISTFKLAGQGEGVGDDENSWAIDGVRHLAWHQGPGAFDFTWSTGDVIGIAADFINGSLHFARNGNWVVAFEGVQKAIGVGLFPAMSGSEMDCIINLGEHPFVYAGPTDEFEPVSTLRPEVLLLDGVDQPKADFECATAAGIDRIAARTATEWIRSRIAQHRKELECRSADPPPPLRIQEPIPVVSAVIGGEATIVAARSRLEAIVLAQPPLLPSIGLSIPKAWTPVTAMVRALRDGRHHYSAAFASHFDLSDVACGPSATYGAADAMKTEGKMYYEVTLLACGAAPRLGWVAPAFAAPSSKVALGDDALGWGADGAHFVHEARKRDLGQRWIEGDVIGLAADLDASGEFLFARNGTWSPSIGRRRPVQNRRGLFPAVGGDGLHCIINLGTKPFRYTPPDNTYVPVVAPGAPKQVFRLLRGEGNSVATIHRQPYLSISKLHSLWVDCATKMGITVDLVVEDILQLLTQQGEIFCSHGIAYLDPARCCCPPLVPFSPPPLPCPIISNLTIAPLAGVHDRAAQAPRQPPAQPHAGAGAGVNCATCDDDPRRGGLSRQQGGVARGATPLPLARLQPRGRRLRGGPHDVPRLRHSLCRRGLASRPPVDHADAPADGAAGGGAGVALGSARGGDLRPPRCGQRRPAWDDGAADGAGPWTRKLRQYVAPRSVASMHTRRRRGGVRAHGAVSRSCHPRGRRTAGDRGGARRPSRSNAWPL